MSPKLVGAFVLLAVIASAAVGWVASSSISSPAEVAARTAAPPASPILVPVETRVLSTDIVTRGSARFGSPQTLSLAPSALKPASSLVDTLPSAGTVLGDGEILLTISGRPVFLFEGDQPAYRDLGPGLSGTDVLQFEEALQRLGFDPGPVDGEYDSATELAVEMLYAASGHEPMRATADQLAGIRTLEADLSNARLEILSAEEAVTSAEEQLASARAAHRAASVLADGAPVAVQAARDDAAAADEAAAAEIARAEAALRIAELGTPAQPSSAAEISAAEADLAVANASVQTTRLAGERLVADARAAVSAASRNLAAAEAEARTNNAVANADAVAKQAALNQLRNTPGATSAEVATAEAEVAAANANVETVRLAGERLVSDAQAAMAAAPGNLAAAETEAEANDRAATAELTARQAALDLLNATGSAVPPTSADVDAARTEVEIARSNAELTRLAGEQAIRDAATAAALASADVQATSAAIAAIEETIALRREAVNNRAEPAALASVDLDSARRGAGVQVPADEIVFVPSAPVRVSELSVTRGDEALGPVVSVTDAIVAIDASFALDEALLVEPGMSVTIDESDLGIDATGVVNVLAEGPGTNGVDGFHVYAEIVVDDAPPNLVGASVRLTVPVESSSGDVLAVPASALALAADGSSRVEVSDGDAIRSVVVEPGLAASGFVEVAAGELAEGDLVVVGFEQAGAAGG